MKINWKLRFKNKIVLTSLITMIIAIIYKFLDLFNIIPPFEQKQIIDIVDLVIGALSLVGIVTDPSTEGLGDSERALGYSEPYSKSNDADGEK